ncbi:MAG: hypothetical protein GY720_10855 [bacterium]|nr:hypothetical protein [bacterium]
MPPDCPGGARRIGGDGGQCSSSTRRDAYVVPPRREPLVAKRNQPMPSRYCRRCGRERPWRGGCP